MHVWLTTLTIQRLFLGMLKAKLGSVLSPVYLAMISIRVEAPKAKRRLPDIGNSTQAERVSCGWVAPKQEEAQYV